MSFLLLLLNQQHEQQRLQQMLEELGMRTNDTRMVVEVVIQQAKTEVVSTNLDDLISFRQVFGEIIQGKLTQWVAFEGLKKWKATTIDKQHVTSAKKSSFHPFYKTSKPIHTIKSSINFLKSMCFTHDGECIIIPDETSYGMNMYNVTDGKLKRHIKNVFGGIKPCPSPKGTFIGGFLGFSGEFLAVLDAKTFERVVSLVHGGVHNSNRRRTTVERRMSDVIQQPDNKIIMYNEVHGISVGCVCFDPSEEFMAFGTSTGNVYICRVGGNWEVLHSMSTIHSEFVWDIRFVMIPANVDYSLQLITASSDHTLKLTDVNSGKVLNVFEGHRSDVYCVAFSPLFGVYSGSSDGSVIRWDLNGTIVRKLENVDILFSLDLVDSILATAGTNGTIRIWTLPDMIELCSFKHGNNVNVSLVCFSPCGRWLASSGNDGFVQLWHD
jgi:WD40 repeat protein